MRRTMHITQTELIGGGSLAVLATTPFMPAIISPYVVIVSAAVLVSWALLRFLTRKQDAITADAGDSSAAPFDAMESISDTEILAASGSHRGLFNEVTENFFDPDENVSFIATKREIRHVRDMLNIRYGATDRAALEKKLRAFIRANAPSQIPASDLENAQRRIRIAKMLVKDILEGGSSPLVVSQDKAESIPPRAKAA
ncbi:hypothetical protein [Beijerinckia mobilis]|uniref:hypothetical protein n=1 Tax=Beijerinckia mobilis TaxID=231434 RepID=UPI0012EC621A|nr:hypothetical protein [Beijerinckia mobilis]